MNWSLEHVHDPKKYFSFISDRLEESGYSLITIPNYDGLIYRIDKSNVELPIHLYHFKYKNIEDYCKIFDLEIKSFKTFSYASMFYYSSLVNKNFMNFHKFSLIQLKYFQKFLDETTGAVVAVGSAFLAETAVAVAAAPEAAESSFFSASS